ncbi:MAG TPA: tail fiber domain-containing protein [Bacteroidales bacterium]|nr:tail fiber domain-containing protein [Bacteroidales bacterium]
MKPNSLFSGFFRHNKWLCPFAISFLLLLQSPVLTGQSPYGFNYQAIARDGSGIPITNYTFPQVKLAILSDSLYATVIWEEVFTNVSTNAFGLFTLTLGRGTRQATSSVPYFSSINWNNWPVFVRTQINYQGTWENMGISRLWSVPYSLVSNIANFATGIKAAQPYLSVSGNTSVMDSALFIVRNNTGQVIFAVYNEGVRIYVDNGAKGNKGGFAVGGFGTGKAASQEYLRVTGDSTRIYVNPSSSKGAKGGFAVGGFGGKGVGSYMNLTPNNYFIGQGSGSNLTTGLYNSFLGYQAGASNTSGYYNVFLGYLAGYSNTTGSWNDFIGFDAGYYNADGDGNTFVGEGAGFLNKHGGTNTFVGTDAGYSNNASFNTFMGYNAGYADTSGNENIFIGYYAASGNKAGSGNIVIGQQAGQYNEMSRNTLIGDNSGRNTGGADNVFVGYATGYANSGSGNVFIGSTAGSQTSGSSNNVAIGFNAGYYLSGSNNVAIGYNAGYSLSGNNKLIVCNSAVTTTPLLYGDFSTPYLVIGGTASNSKTFYVNGTAGGSSGWSVVSDSTKKKNIEELSHPLDKVLSLHGVSFEFRENHGTDKGRKIGFIAQEVEPVVPEVVSKSESGYMMEYAPITALLVEAVKEQHGIIKEQKARIESLSGQVESLTSRVEQLESAMLKLQNK